jgi:hypothetical protein
MNNFLRPFTRVFLLFIAIICSSVLVKGQYCTTSNIGPAPCITNVSLNTLNNTTACTANASCVEAFAATTTLVIGQTYTFSISSATAITSFWIDFDHNLVFDTYEWYQPYTNGTTGTVSITVPFTAVPGVTGMRVRSRLTGNFNGAGDACTLMGSGETEDYSITLVPGTPCSGQPTAGVANASNLTPCPGSTVNFTLTGSTLASGLSYQWLRGNTTNGPWVLLPGATSLSYSVLAPTGTKCYRCIVTCLSNGLFDTSSAVCITTQTWSPTGTCWCVPTYANGGTGDIMTNITLGTLNNSTTGNVTPFYNDYTSLQQGASPTLSIPNLFGGLTSNLVITYGTDPNQYGAVWIDFNHNGAFEATEYFSHNSNAGASGVATISILTPGTAVGGLTRMRIRGGDDVQMTDVQACGATNSTYGETEDYLVNIIPPVPKDPAITALVGPSGNCFTANETITATMSNYGNTNINLLLDSVKVKLHVNGPNGLVTYSKTVNTGALFSLNGNSVPVVFNGVDMYAGGSYSMCTSLQFAPPGGGATNVYTWDDTMCLSRLNYRPTAGPDFHVCKDAPILFGQGLTVSGCASPINDSVEVVFNVTPCIDNVGATATTTSQTVPGAACANEFACNFGNGVVPALPIGAYFTQNARLTITNLSSGYNAEVRFNLYAGSPVPPNLFAPCTQGYPGPTGNQLLAGQSIPPTGAPFTNYRQISPTQLSSLFATVPAGQTFNIGYFESYNDLQNSSDISANFGGTTTAKLKIYYTYIPASIKWYDNNTSTVQLDSLVPFNPLSPTVMSPTTQMTNTGSVGTYTFFATCDGAVDCRVPVNLIVDPIPAVFQDTISLCETAVGSNQAIFDLTTLNASVSGGTYPTNSVAYFGDQSLFGPIATPTSDTSGTVIVYSKVSNAVGCYSSDTVLLNVSSIPEFSPNIVSSNVCAPASIDIDNMIGAFSTVPLGSDTLYFEDPACTISFAGNPHAITSADTVYMVLLTNTVPSCSDTAVAFVNISQATNMIVNQVVPGNYSDCMTPIACGNVTLTDGGVQTLFTTPDCRKVANVTDVVNSIDLGSTQICETIDCTVQTHNNQPYVNRVYQITPTTNDQGTLCLYYLDDDFDQYNAYAAVNGWPYLPVGIGSPFVNNIAISRVENGPVSASGSYIGATIPSNLITTTYDPATTVWTLCFPTDSFSHFYVHSLNPNNVPLPVNLEFSGKRVEGSSVLSWITSMERNNSHFVVERSRDGAKFSPISGNINSKATQGNSSSPLSYGYTDASPNNGHNYYRLQQHDVDGHQSYSKVVDIYFGSDIMVTLYPNPVKTTLHVDISTPKATLARASIIDAAGRIVRQVDLQLQAGSNASELDMQGLADGMYQIRISNDKGLDYTQTIRKN